MSKKKKSDPYERHARAIAKKIEQESRKDWIRDEVALHHKKASSTKTPQSGQSVNSLDILRDAKRPGRRRSKGGNIYYEYRKNRSDIPGSRI